MLLFLAGCGDHQPLPPPGVGSTVAVHIWDPGANEPTVVVADRIRQEGLRIERMLLDQVRARVLWPNLDCSVSSPSGYWSTSTGLLTLIDPVHIAGTYQGHPMLGVATSASMARDGHTIVLEHLELWYQGDLLTAPIAELRQEQGLVAPRGLTRETLPEEMRAVFAALPDPMAIPR